MTGILILARLGSTRLKRKHLIKAGGQTFLEWLIDRMAYSFRKEIAEGQAQIVICTSEEKENEEFEAYAKAKNCKIYYGNRENIPFRQLECAKALGFDHIISIDGDDILCSAEAAHDVYEELMQGKELVKTADLPLGMNISGGYSTALLNQVIHHRNAGAKLETGWGSIFEGKDYFVINYPFAGIDIRATLDYDDDAIFFTKVIESIGDKVVLMPDAELINTIIKNDFPNLNLHLNNTYWTNFNEQRNLQNRS
jgi:spore coat polysaccharide biosynthesis protein SpsF (cytidylyltransferase family)